MPSFRPIPAADRALDEIRSGAVGGLSVEFRPVKEGRDADTRVIEDAVLTGTGIVRAPSYKQSNVEARRRSGRTLRARIPADETFACECNTDTRWARVIKPAMDQMWTESFAEGHAGGCRGLPRKLRDPDCFDCKGHATRSHSRGRRL